MTKPSFRYVTATISEREHAVFIVHASAPELWRHVATFHDFKRADQFTQIENDMIDDGDLHWEGDLTPPSESDLPPEPAFGIMRGKLVRVAPVAEIPRADVALPMSEREEGPVPSADDEAVCADKFTPPDLVDVSTLPAITPAQNLALQQIAQLISEGNHAPNAALLRAGGNAAVTMLYTLQKKGFLRNLGHGKKPHWVVAFSGEPRVETWRPGEQNQRRKAEAPQAKRRFTETKPLAPENVNGLAADHPALKEGRTLFPSTVVAPSDSRRLLLSGANQRKLGDRVTKGPWANFPIYHLTLEERATCPSTCFHWSTCYGNGMPQARRHRNDADLIPLLRAELVDLQEDHPDGFVVRLHILGDFYSVEYVSAWASFIEEFPALRVFGYTAWPRGSEIGAALKRLTDTKWDRFAIRFSDAASKPQGATTIFRVPEATNVPEGIVCPAQTDKTDCCGTCGLCWSQAAKDKTIVFVAHGRVGGAPRQEVAATTKAPLTADAARIQLGAYLRAKRVDVAVLGKGRFQVRGRFMDYEELFEFANELRREDGLPEFGGMA